MIRYDLGSGVEAFSTEKRDSLNFEVTTPQWQAHSANVALLPTDADNTYGVDALLTNVPGLRIGVRTADCVPILLYDPLKRAVGAVHSGWKGTVANIVGRAVERMMAEYGSDPATIRALVGPCIHQEAFEVGEEVRERFVEAGYADFCRWMRNPHLPDSAEKWHVDLPGVCRKQLIDSGVRDIEVRDECTFANSDRLFSYRRNPSDSRQERIFTTICLSCRS